MAFKSHLVITTLLLLQTNLVVEASRFVGLNSTFSSPVQTYGPHVFWHWVNGNIEKTALDQDIQALYAAGHGGALIYDVNAGIPRGPVDYNSDEWLDLLVHAVDGLSKNGMLAAMHNSPGYSGIGSTKLPVNKTMKELVWTESRVGGSNYSLANTTLVLQKPFSKLGVYQDLFALAYPVLPGEKTVFRDAVTSIAIDGTVQNTTVFKMIDRDRPLRLSSNNSVMDIQMKDYFTAQAIAIYRIPETPLNAFDGSRDYPPSWNLAVSNDSASWTNVAVSGSYPALREMDAPAVLTFSPVIGKYFRLRPSSGSWVTGIDISSSPRLPNWAVKAHGAAGTAVNTAVIANISEIIEEAAVIDVTQHMDANGKLEWKPSNGTYTVVRMGYTVTAQEMPATPDSETGALSVDLFDTTAIDAHFDTHLERIIEALAPYTPNTFYGMEIDSYELGMQNWGGDLESDFQRLRGYSLRPWILAATGRVVANAEASEQFLYDFRLTHSDLMTTNCYGYFQKRLGDHGISLMVEPYGDGPFDSMALASVSDQAYGEFWAHYTYGSDGYSTLGQSSTDEKHVEVVPSEAYTGQPDDTAWTEHPYQLKSEGDRMMTMGPNRFFLHSYPHQPVDEALPGMTFGPFGSHFDRHNTWAQEENDWTSYLRRSSYLLQNAQRVVRIGCFIGEEPTATPPATYNTPYAVPLAYQADVFAKANILNMTASGDAATYPSGQAYRLLIFPAMPAASAAVLAKMLELAQAGVAISLPSTLPSRSITLGDDNDKVLSYAAKLWAMAGNGNVFVGNTTVDVIGVLGITPDVTFTAEENDAAIYSMAKTTDGDKLFFITNALRKQVKTVVSLLGTGAPEIYDPMTGEIKDAPVSASVDGRVAVSLDLGPSQSLFIRLTNDDNVSGTLSKVQKDGTTLYTTQAYAAFNPSPYTNVSSSFTVAFWAKPEIAQVGTTGYVFYPYNPSATYGAHHAASAISLGWNGIQLGEATTAGPVTVFSRTWANNNFSLSGWTHVAVVYSANTPTLYVNGAVVGSGPQSTSTVHPGVDLPDATQKMINRFVGDIAGMEVTPTSWSASDVKAAFADGLPAPSAPPSLTFLSDGSVLAREDGNYSFQAQNATYSPAVAGTKTYAINGSWSVTLPADRLPPSRGNQNLTITLATLTSLKNHEDFDVAHFSGTATYRSTFNASTTGPGDRYLLDLGRVENIARVVVNGKDFGTVWMFPYEIDITSAIGYNNVLTVDVTNTWANRLIGDESLPQEARFNQTAQDYAVEEWPSWFESGLNGEEVAKPGDRVTFAAWKHYNATDPLFESGLLGPVVLRKAKVIDIFGS
ncbi:hypothetical protein MBLNU459_g4839t1 [Dothideomycetes sp. NU459]